MSRGFQNVLDHIRAVAGSEVEKGRLFERLMKAYFEQDPLYRDRFSDVWLWSQWTETRTDFAGRRHGHRSRSCRTRWRLLRHPVQVVMRRVRGCRRRISIPLSPPRRASHSRRASSSIPATSGGPKRGQDHRTSETRLRRAPLRRSHRPSVRLARSGARTSRRRCRSGARRSACGHINERRSTM